MSGILTITLNPAIDKSTTIDNLIAEKKLRCSPPHFEPGGGGINVARAIKKLGGEATAMYLAGGYSGSFFNDLLEKEQVNTIPVLCNGHTRENMIVFEKSTGKQYRFGMPGPLIEEKEWKMILDKIEITENIEYLVASGSLPDGIPEDIFKRISAIANKKKMKFILDSSGAALKESLEEGLFLIKPNLNELSLLTGVEEIKKAAVVSAAKSIIDKGKCNYIVVSMGASGAMLVSEKEHFHIQAPEVKSVSTVGAGDSMVAGIIYGLSRGYNIKQAVQYGVACGTAATMNPGTELCHKSDVALLFSKMQAENTN